MCAINGIAGNVAQEDAGRVERMNAATRHRGPDGSRVHVEAGVALGFNRLAIIDLNERAMQPMVDAARRYTLIFNGEIYNYQELKKELAEYPFATESDTEVILAAYSRWGDAAFSRLNGMFALAIWDANEKRLVLARDSVGIKPLYYHQSGQQLLFSSEIKAIVEVAGTRTLDTEAFGHYLRLLYVPAPLTMFAGIRKLLPGHILVYQDGSLAVEPFRGRWPDPAAPRSYSEAVSQTRAAVEAAVARQLVSDRPVGVYLSGGIDSSTVLAAASETHPAIDTFSVGFELSESEEQGKFNADSEMARRTAKHFGATHHEFLLSSGDVLRLFSETVRHLDEPIGNATALSQLYLARQVKPISTVVLTGEGGDELFGGYERYRLAKIAELLGAYVPRSIAQEMFGIENMHLSGVDRFAQLMFQKDAEVLPLLSSRAEVPDTRALFADSFSEKGSVVSRLLLADERNWLVDEALMRADKTSMAGSVEARVPLLDLEVRALAHLIPTSYKVGFFSTKRVLKDAFRDRLPHEVLRAPKRGWFSPGAKWLRHDNFIQYAEVAFSADYAPGVGGLFDFSAVRRAWKAHLEKREYHYTILFALLAFLEWAREYRVSLR